MSKQVAFLGLGLMGGAIAANLARHGYQVKAWNRTQDKPGVEVAAAGGAEIVNSLEEAVKNAGIVFTCVGDVPDVQEVLLGDAGVVQYAQSHTLVVDMSTIGSKATREIGAALQQQQLRFMDAPVSGGDIGAVKGTLTIMVGGSEADFQECLPLLEAVGKNITLCGAIGSGQAMQMAKQQGIDPNLIVKVCGTGAAGSWALSNLGEKIINGDYEPGFAIKHIVKDLRLVQEINQGSGDNLPGTELADRLFKIVGEMDNGQGQEKGKQEMIRAYLESRV